jgi:hypothetical protein
MLAVAGAATSAEETRTGLVTVINRIDGTITIRPSQNGTVGAAIDSASEQFKLPGKLSHAAHAGDMVNFTVTEDGGTKTIGTIEVKN